MPMWRLEDNFGALSFHLVEAGPPSTTLSTLPGLSVLGIFYLASCLTIGVLGLQIWVLGIELGSSELHSKCFYLLSPLAGVL